jgi:alpha-2-macroglobulin
MTETGNWGRRPRGADLDLPCRDDRRNRLELAARGTGQAVGDRPFAGGAAAEQKPLSPGYRIVAHACCRGSAAGRRQLDARRHGARALEIEAQADMTWVVVDDPVPAGATILGSGLGGESQILARRARSGSAWPAFEERRFDAFRAYYRYVPKGTWTVEYTMRLNNAGHVPAAADAGRGDVCARDVRRTAERHIRSAALSRLLPIGLAALFAAAPALAEVPSLDEVRQNSW